MVVNRIEPLMQLPDGPAKTAGLAAWVQSLFPPDRVPVLVGGGAVELYTGGAYTTGDLDFVGTVTSAVASELERSGFAKHGRHWVHEVGQVFIEFQGAALAPGESAAIVEVGVNQVLVVRLEDLVAERLATWQGWRSMVDGINAWLLYSLQETAIDRSRLRERVSDLGCEAAFASLLGLARRALRRDLRKGELEEWAMQIP